MLRYFSYTETVTCNGSGAATVYFGKRIHGRVKAIKYTPGTIDTNGDLTFTGETTGLAILTVANAGTSIVTFRPMALAHKISDGSAYTDLGVPVPVVDERIKLVVAQGGDSGAGSVTIITEEDQ